MPKRSKRPDKDEKDQFDLEDYDESEEFVDYSDFPYDKELDFNDQPRRILEIYEDEDEEA